MYSTDTNWHFSHPFLSKGELLLSGTGAEGEEGEEGNPKAAIGVVPSTMLEDSVFILRPWYILKTGL